MQTLTDTPDEAASSDNQNGERMTEKRALITGITGQDGSDLAARLTVPCLQPPGCAFPS